MPTSSIAQILLRLFALNWLVAGIIQLAGVLFLPGRGFFEILSLSPALVYIVAAALAWSLSPPLSRLLARRNDGEFNLAGVTERQLYATAFLALGLYFALNSFANVFSWIHFFVSHKSPDHGFHQGVAPSYYRLTEGLMTLIAGIGLMFTARTWAAKLTPRADVEKAPGDR